MKPIRPSWKASTHTSLAALYTAGAVPPSRPASRASSTAGKATLSSGSKIQLDALLHRTTATPQPSRPAQSKRDRKLHIWRRTLCKRGPVDELHHGVHDRLRMYDDIDPVQVHSYSRCASSSSRPLLTSVAELVVMTRPMFQVGCASADQA